jgi:hypothetical protein
LVYTSAAMGPIESIAQNTNGSSTITILGQSFVSWLEGTPAGVGDYVLAGSHENGELAVLMPIGESYVPGASSVWLVGAVDAVSAPIAQFSVGSISVDYSALLSADPTLAPQSGDMIDVFGLQPAPGGSLVLGIHGSDSRVRGIHGSDRR